MLQVKRPRLRTQETPTTSDIEDDALKCTPCGLASHHNHVEAICEAITTYGELGQIYTLRQLF